MIKKLLSIWQTINGVVAMYKSIKALFNDNAAPKETEEPRKDIPNRAPRPLIS